MHIHLRNKQNLIFTCDDIYRYWKIFIYLLDEGYNPTNLFKEGLEGWGTQEHAF